MLGQRGSELDALIIFARSSSTRLPGKALKPLGRSTLLETVIEQTLGFSEYKPILATSDRSEDDDLEFIAKKMNIFCFRGELDNVAARTAACLRAFRIQRFARINGDGPFVRMELINKAFELLQSGDDLVTNIYPRSYPYGISVEALKAELFLKAFNKFDSDEREHITTYFYRNISTVKYTNITSKIEFDTTMHLAVDDQKSYGRINRMFQIDPEITKKTITRIAEVYHESYFESHAKENP